MGGRYFESGGSLRMSGQAYVQRRALDLVRFALPIVMVPGEHQTLATFETTAERRPGWANQFIASGFAIYLFEPPGVGRSPFIDATYGSYAPPPNTRVVENRLTSPAKSRLWPQARLHTQWPGTGRPGDPAFDDFYASLVPTISNAQLREELYLAAGVALLDRIGPAILLTHSHSGAYALGLGAARPSLVRGIVAVEPSPDVARTDHAANASGIPVIVVTAEASEHCEEDDQTVRNLRELGVDVDHVHLAELGIRGNGHMMMLESNADAVAAAIVRRLSRHGLAEPRNP